MYAKESPSISISRTLGEGGRVWTIYATEGPSVCGSCAAKLECFLWGRSARVHAAACVSQEDEDAELGCNSSSASVAAEALASTLPRASLKRTKTRQWTATAGSHETVFVGPTNVFIRHSVGCG